MSNVTGRRSSQSGTSNTEIAIIVVAAIIIVAGVGAILAILLFTPFGGPIIPSVNPSRLVPSGNLVTEQESFNDFTNVRAGSAFEIVITQSSSFSVSITADDNVIDFIQISKIAETLDIDITPGTSITSGPLNQLTLRIEIMMPELYELELSGAAGGVVTGFTSLEEFVLDLSGASRVVIEGDANDLIFRGSGASNANLSNFPVHNAEVDISGASEATINVDGRLDAEVSGVSTLLYIGDPTLGDIDISSLATMRKI